MIVKLEENISQKEIEVLIRYAKKTKMVERLQELIESADKTVKCRTDTGELWIKASDIFYIESVDKRTFVYGDKAVYRTELRLYQLAEELMSAGFVRASKSCLININMLKEIRPLFNSRLEATLTNGEKINVTRKYISEIRSRLERR